MSKPVHISEPLSEFVEHIGIQSRINRERKDETICNIVNEVSVRIKERKKILKTKLEKETNEFSKKAIGLEIKSLFINELGDVLKKHRIPKGEYSYVKKEVLKKFSDINRQRKFERVKKRYENSLFPL